LRVKIHKKFPENQKFWDYGERLKLGLVGGRDAYLGSESLSLSVPPRMRRGRGRGAGRRGEAERVWFCWEKVYITPSTMGLVYITPKL
jgi:hypothetical protein